MQVEELLDLEHCREIRKYGEVFIVWDVWNCDYDEVAKFDKAPVIMPRRVSGWVSVGQDP